MSKDRIYLDIHAIQTMPPSNVNRDDTGSPKTAMYGGVRRARVSSQSWKRAMRAYFMDNSSADLGIRSLDIVRYLAERIMILQPDIQEETAMEKADELINKAGIKTKDMKAKALFFLGKKQAEELASLAVAGEASKQEVQGVLKSNPAIDISLFGRMVADDPSLNEDASAQVAHAMSTHGVQTEFDFYTAVDDLAPEDNAGAGMLGTVEYNSSTLYRYANVAVHDVLRQLEDKETVVNTLKLFVEAFCNSMPTGKINTFANQTLPQLVMVNIRTDRPVNLVSAFEKPVIAKDGYVAESIERLFAELKKSEKFVNTPAATFVLADNDECPEKEESSMGELLNDMASEIEKLLH